MEKHRISVRIEKKKHALSVRQRLISRNMLVFLHGLGGSQEVFQHVWNLPEFNGLSIFTLDFLGFGESDKPENFSYRMEAQAKVLNTLIKPFADYHLHIVAHSMGGAVGLLMDDEILDKVSSFSNLEGNLISEDCFLSRKAIVHSDEYFYHTFFPKLKKNMSGLGLLSTDLERTLPAAFFKSCQSLVHWSDSGFLLSRFKSLNSKKAYFYGDRNADIEPLNQLKGVPRVEISNSGHMMMLDNPEEFYSKLKSFLF